MPRAHNGRARSDDRALRDVGLIVSDVDGVVTDRRIVVLEGGELRSFNAFDGLAVGLARTAGIPIAWISRKVSAPVEARARELGIELHMGILDKGACLREVAARRNVPIETVAFLADDLQDLAAFAVCGVPVAVADAVPEVRRAAKVVLARRGGEGALRELVERTLRSQGRWREVVEDFVGVRFDKSGRVQGGR